MAASIPAGSVNMGLDVGSSTFSLIDSLRAGVPAQWLTAFALVLGLALVLRTPFARRVGRICEELFLTNWRLGLLAATGIVLSLAACWTTYEGMRNFTGETYRSAMITFGIQGVMLIVAWLIGEAFATGMNQRAPSGVAAPGNAASIKVAVGIVFAAILVAGIALVISGFRGIGVGHLYAFSGLLLVVGLVLLASKVTTLRAYFDALRVMVQTAMLWVMFLACMAASVFFSFDSHFSSVFPQSERVRAADLRAQNQVAGIISEIGTLTTSRQLSEAEALFSAKGWSEYDTHLQNLARAAQGSQAEIETYFTSQMEQRRRAVAEQQERIATAASSQAGLSNKKTALADELSRLKADRPGVVEEVRQRRETVDATIKELDAKRVEVLAEERGVEGTGKVGRGAMYRQRKAEEDSLKEKLKIAEERLREPQARLTRTDTRIVQIERELSSLDGDLAKLKGETQTAESRIKLAEDTRAAEESGMRVDPTRMLPAFERARQDFRQAPAAEGLAELQRQCTQLLAAMAATPATRAKVAGIDCDPKSASEAAGRVFALNDGLKVFGTNCQGGDKLTALRGADALFEFARKCTQDSGLAAADTDELRRKINWIELNRDDKANRFVVTWNAFNDGNRLAYLALALAITVDTLIFMSGLFAANAVRSPLSDVPSVKARSAEHLEQIIDNALLPARFENARLVIEAMDADTSRPGYTAVVDLGPLDLNRRAVVSRVLNAGATINAVLRDEPRPNRYFIRSELFEYLSVAGSRAFEKDGALVKEDIAETLKLARLEKDVSDALIPAAFDGDVGRHTAMGAQTVLDHLRPYPDPEDTGYRSELRLADFQTESDARLARRVLTAGSNLRLVEVATFATTGEPAAQAVEGRYVLHADFVTTLSRLRARLLLSTAVPAQGGRPLRTVEPSLGREAAARLPFDDLPGPSADVLPIGAPAQSLLETSVPTPAGDSTLPVETPLRDTDLFRELVEHFGREMGQQSATIEYLVRHHGRIDVATLHRSLDVVLRHDPQNLRGPMSKAIRNIEQNIDEARASFPSALLTAPGAAAELNDFADMLKQMTIVMVMLPGAAYDNLINKMDKELEDDAGAGKLDPARAQKHRIVVVHRSELARAEYTEDDWAAVLQSLMKFEHGLAALAGSDQRPSRMA
jgi:hypothetical protein